MDTIAHPKTVLMLLANRRYSSGTNTKLDFLAATAPLSSMATTPTVACSWLSTVKGLTPGASRADYSPQWSSKIRADGGAARRRRSSVWPARITDQRRKRRRSCIRIWASRDGVASVGGSDCKDYNRGWLRRLSLVSGSMMHFPGLERSLPRQMISGLQCMCRGHWLMMITE